VTGPTPALRKIIHVDMDMFYAAIELRERPQLVGKPIAVGGRPESRGVVATANYVARRFGIHSAMPMSRAVRLCPDLVVVPPRMDMYVRESRRLSAILAEHTELIEPLSLDEAYLDVSGAEHLHGSATLIATAIRSSIREQTGLTASAGVAPNKFLAKVASDWRKPDGLTVIRPEHVDAFVAELPVKRIPGVGPKTAQRLAGLGVTTCLELQRWSEAELADSFGKWGPRLYSLARGRDDRPVITERVRKSLSVERTYAEDLPDLAACFVELASLWERFGARYERADVAERVRGWTVKVRFDDFETTTMDRTPTMLADGRAPEPTLQDFEELFEQAWARGGRPVRLIGIGVRLEAPPTRAGSLLAGSGRQLELWPEGW